MLDRMESLSLLPYCPATTVDVLHPEIVFNPAQPLACQPQANHLSITPRELTPLSYQFHLADFFGCLTNRLPTKNLGQSRRTLVN